MKKLCDCNSDWVITDSLPYGCNIPTQTSENVICTTCGYYIWYDPQYENMMIDLKFMNKC